MKQIIVNNILKNPLILGLLVCLFLYFIGCANGL